MREQAQSRSALDDTTVIQLTLLSGRSSLRLKSWLPEYTTGGRPVVLGGRELPSQVGATLSHPVHVLCVGLGEWLIELRECEVPALRALIEPDLPKQGLVLVDLTDGLVILEARGSAIREVLSKGCALDLHPRTFLAGRCARTRFAQIAIVIERRLDEPSCFELYVPRSYIRYLHAWLTDAASEMAVS
jgi:sarcosine oxidase subunit gamma